MAAPLALIIAADPAGVACLRETLNLCAYTALGPLASGEEAAALLRDRHPDLIVVDIDLPGKTSGLETAAEIAAIADTPILFLIDFSREHPQEQLHQAALLGSGFLSLVPSRQEVETVTAMALNRHRLQRALREQSQQDRARRQQAEATLREREDYFRSLSEDSPDGILRYDRTNGMLPMNLAARQLMAGPGENGADGPTEGADGVALASPLPEERFSEVLATGKPVHCELAFTRNKAIRHLDWRLTPELDRDGRVASVLGVARDITERKRIENVQAFLAQTGSGPGDQPFFQALASYLARTLGMDFVCIDQLEGDHLTARTVAVWCDGHFADNISYGLRDTPCGEVVGKVVCCYPAGVARRFPQDSVLKELRAEGYAGVTLWDHQRKPIGLIAVISRSPLENPGLTETVLQMVAVRAAAELERLRARETLRTALQRFQIILSSLYPGILVVSDEERVEYLNQSLLDLFSIPGPPEALIGLRRSDLLRHMIAVIVDPSSFLERTREIHARRQPIRDEEVAIRGGRTYLRDYIPIEIDGRQYGRLWLYSDITDRKKAVAALQESEQRFRSYFDMGLIGMAMTTPDRHYIHFNDRFCQILGYAPEEVARKTWLELTHPDDRAEDLYRIERLERGETDTFQREKRYIRKDGTIAHVEVSARCIRTPDGAVDHLVTMIQDISQRKAAQEQAKKLQTQLLQAQKLEAIGTLAGGIAHDFNNILAAVIGYADMASELTPPGTPLAMDLEQVIKAGHRAKDLVRQILVFSRQTETEPVILFPATIIKEVVKLLRPSLPSTISISHQINPQAGPVCIDPTQLHQVLMNLCTNAFHAMEEKGGTLTITLQRVEIDAPCPPASAPACPGAYVRLSVIDTGAGIPREHRDRIFDPFFTTKEMGKGTGMGLSIVHGIVASYHGFITLESGPRQGTAFHIHLPVATQFTALEHSAAAPLPQGSEHILFVDDEEALAAMTRSMLERLGYRVTVRTSSLEALTTFQNQPELFDLVITDQTMPGLTGLDLARRLLLLRPDIPIILCTGYSTLISEDKAKAHGIREFALKPLSRRDLAVLIRKVLQPH